MSPNRTGVLFGDTQDLTSTSYCLSRAMRILDIGTTISSCSLPNRLVQRISEKSVCVFVCV